jgi:hypothetical protein
MQRNNRRRQSTCPCEAVTGEFLREIVSHPFRLIALAPSWIIPTAVALAQEIYNTRGFDHLPTLADALMEAGCANAEILAHC